MRTPLSAALMQGVEHYLYEQRLSLMVTHLRENDRLPVCLEKRQVDGIIIRAGNLSPALNNRLRGYPAVWIFQPTQKVDWADEVSPDNEAVGQLALEHLMSVSQTPVVVLHCGTTFLAFRQRIQAFVSAAERAGIPCESIDVNQGNAQHRVRVRLRSPNRPKGIFFVGHESNLEFLAQALKDLDLRSGRDTTVITCMNDLPHIRAMVPGIVNVDIQPQCLGRMAADRLMWRLANPKEPTQRLLVAPRLIVA